VFGIQSEKNCLKGATGRFQDSKSETDADTDRMSKKEEEKRSDRYRPKGHRKK
jgi:hypothetical protein